LRIVRWRPGVLFVLASAAAACAAPEQALLEEFFGASRLRDLTALQPIATVVFEPREQGIVRTFEIAGVTERGDGRTKEVRVNAPVILPDGRTVQKLLVVTLERREAGGAARWVVTGVTDAGASPPSRPS
jgi:hypothetical protein